MARNQSRTHTIRRRNARELPTLFMFSREVLYEVFKTAPDAKQSLKIRFAGSDFPLCRGLGFAGNDRPEIGKKQTRRNSRDGHAPSVRGCMPNIFRFWCKIPVLLWCKFSARMIRLVLSNVYLKVWMSCWVLTQKTKSQQVI